MAVASLGTLAILSWILKYTFYGIDFTDESSYLVWISNPFSYGASASQFGFIYRPLYILLGGDIAALRQANILITFGLGWALAHTHLTSLAPEVDQGRVDLHVTAAGLSVSSLILFNTWLATPNYNSLAFQALLITAIGLLLAEKAFTYRSSLGWIIIGIGGWLAFMAKPSTAVALAVGIFICLLVARKVSIRLMLLTAVTALGLLLSSALMIDGSISGFVKRLQLAAEFSQYLGGGHTIHQILRIDNFRVRAPGQIAILSILVAALVAIWGAYTEKPKGAIVSLIVAVGFFSVTALLAFGQVHKTAGLGEFEGLLIFGVVFAAALTGLIFGGPAPLKSISSVQWAVSIIFLVMPHIYAFGTNRNYWENGAWVGIFWLLAGTTLLRPVVRKRGNWSFALPLALAAQTVTAILLQTGLERPQRQTQPLRLNETPLEIGPHRSVLVLSAGYAAYLTDAAAAAQSSGFEIGTPVIDLSGQSPGILYAIGAESIGQAWTIGGYPGSLKLAKAALERVACEKIAAAWILFEPDGPRSVPVELMPSLGAAFPEAYQQVGTWRTAPGAGGYDGSRTQELYKPTAPIEVLNACRAIRAKEMK
ncbi:Putative membrane protein [Neorhizobium galegae bv. officinalis]|nr:Putative membrane protein [Neorhizobium galegae bv. officinalis]